MPEALNTHLSLSSSILLAPRRQGLVAGEDNTVEVLVRVQAPDAPEPSAGAVPQRPPQALALVIDRSGSMSGRPLAEAQRCAEYVVSQLRPTDAVALVQFDNRVERLWPAVPRGDGVAVRAAIGRIESGGNTNLHGGWLEGAASLTEVAGAELRRVILLSDGGANEGETEPSVIAAQCAEWRGRGITTSTYGLGERFNEELMVTMARAGGGNSYYGETAEDLMQPFQQELDLLANLALRNLEVAATVPEGIKVEMLNDLPPSTGGWRLADLAWGAEAWAVLRITVPASALPGPGERFSLLRVAVTGRSLQGEAVALEKMGLSLLVMPKAAWEALPEDKLTAQRSDELAAGRVLTQMRLAAREGDWAAVDRMLADARARYAGNEWVAAVLAAMAEVAQSRSRERLMKEAMYSSERLNMRLSSKDEMRFSVESIELPSFLRRKPQQGKGDV